MAESIHISMNKKLLGILAVLVAAIVPTASAVTNDNPKAPENVRVSLSDDYSHVTVSWDAVGNVGESGGSVDVSKITYYIFDAFGSYFDPAIAVTTDTSYTFDYSDVDGQDFVAYQITAGVDEIWYSLASNSPIAVIGMPAGLPVMESFANGKQMGQWVIDPASRGNVSYGCKKNNQVKIHTSAGTEYLNAQDGDNGFFYIEPKEKGATFGFFSTKISLADAVNPVFSFCYQGTGSNLEALLSTDGGEFIPVKEIKLLDEPAEIWQEVLIDLAAYRETAYIQIGFNVESPNGANAEKWNVGLDNIRVFDDDSGMDDLQEDGVKISVVRGGVIIRSTGACSRSIHTLSGICITTGSVSAPTEMIPLSPGIYIVRCGCRTEKIVIK